MPAIQNRDWIISPSEVRRRLELRAKVVDMIRQFFAAKNYLEVQTPTLLPDVCIDAHIDPIAIPVSAVIPARGSKDLDSTTGQKDLFLQTSPEFAMKRLLAMGSGSIWQMTSAFRNGELGPLHNPEFTMIEWYMVGGHYHELMTEVAELVAQILKSFSGVRTEAGEFPRLTYREAFQSHAMFDPFESTDENLGQRCRSLGFEPNEVDRDGLLNFLLATLVEPHLGKRAPTFLYDFPETQCALAKVRKGNPNVAERFELYVNGIEICNGYQELTDAEELLRRNQRQNLLRNSAKKQELPIDSHLIEAMRRGLPECTGVALGFDRLLMLAMDESTLEAYQPFLLSHEL